MGDEGGSKSNQIYFDEDSETLICAIEDFSEEDKILLTEIETKIKHSIRDSFKNIATEVDLERFDRFLEVQLAALTTRDPRTKSRRSLYTSIQKLCNSKNCFIK